MSSYGIASNIPADWDWVIGERGQLPVEKAPRLADSERRRSTKGWYICRAFQNLHCSSDAAIIFLSLVTTCCNAGHASACRGGGFGVAEALEFWRVPRPSSFAGPLALQKHSQAVQFGANSN